MKLTDQQILDYIKTKSDHPMKPKELGQALNITSADYSVFRNQIKSLIATGTLVKLKRGRIGLAAEMNIVVGPISIVRSGVGFVATESDEEDILIPQTQLFTALDGDKVMVRLGGFSGDRQTGTVIKIVEHTGRNIVGVFKKGKHFDTVQPDNPRIHRDLYIPPGKTLEAVDGEKVVAKLAVWTDPHLSPEGEVLERLGMPGKGSTDIMAVIRAFDLPLEFPLEVIDEAERASGQSIEVEIKKRIDLTSDCIYTIDPVDAKDHDDAVSVVETEKGWRLGVHIADVSFFVTPDSELDREAIRRGNSVYLPGKVIPMLPEVLSNDICSLKAGEVRLANSVEIDFDKNGKMLSWKRMDTVIKSKAKLSYEQVQAFFDGDESVIKLKKVQSSLRTARALALKLFERRREEGSLDFDLPESLLVFDDNGEVIRIANRVRLESHRLVEEFMLVANRAMALEVFRAGEKMIYRVHERPDMEKLQDFSAMMARLGRKFPVSDNIRPKQLAKFLEQIKDSPEADFINELMLRSMQKAVYQAENIGHFGLAFTHYTHFTSPIRRYPDLLVHRLLRALKNNKYPVSFARGVGSLITRVGKHCSETERVAERAERQAIKIKQVLFMARHVGKEFDGIITGVTGYGFFVRLDNLGVEGMVRMSTMDDDYYHFEENQYRLVGRRHQKVFRLGDRVKVGVLKVDTTLYEINLYLAQTSKQSSQTKQTKQDSVKGKKVKGKTKRPFPTPGPGKKKRKR